MSSNRKLKTGKCADFRNEKKVDLEKWTLVILTFTEHQSNPGWIISKVVYEGNSRAVQCLGRRAFTAEDAGSIPGWENKIPARHAAKNKKR